MIVQGRPGPACRYFVALCVAMLLGAAGQGGAAAVGATAVIVGRTVVNPAVEPFTATLGSFGAGARLTGTGGGFEPLVFRNRITVTADADDRIVADPVAVTRYRTLRTGALDTADVDIYRIENGRFRHVRRDRVAPGGHQASGWIPLAPTSDPLPAGRTRELFRFPAWYRPGVPIWFAVRSVDARGRLSPPSPAAMATSPGRARSSRGGDPGEPKDAEDDTVEQEPFNRDEVPGRGAASVPSPPAEVSARALGGGRVEIRWRPAPGAAGYVVLYSETPPEAHRGFFLALEGSGARVRAGDMAILSRRFLEVPRAAILADRVWNAGRGARPFRPRPVRFWPDEDPGRSWRLVPHDAETPVEDAGETFLELTIARGASADIGAPNHAGSGQDWYEVLPPVPHTVSVWLRADRPATVQFRLTGALAASVRPVTFAVEREWRRFEAVFTPPEAPADMRPGSMVLEFRGPGRFSVDNFRVHRADTPWLAMPAEDRARLAESGMSALRTHAFIKTGWSSYGLEDLTNPAGAIAAVEGGNTLPQTLAAIAATGRDPWLQIEPHLSPDEWRGLVEYLAAPFDPARHDRRQRPWAAKRHAQGRPAPWTDAFGRIYLEVGNETWNRMFAPWTFGAMRDSATGERLDGGTVYGLWVQHVIDMLRSSPYWVAADLDDKVVFVLGGARGRPAYGRAAAAAAPDADILAVAAYNGGWDEGEGPPAPTPASFLSVLNQVPQRIAATAADLSATVRALSTGRRRLDAGTYEAGPGYALDGLNGARVTAAEALAQERVMKSQAAGVATLDAFLAQAAEGFALQNFFAFGAGWYWKSHAAPHRGGATYPSWMLLSLFNAVGTGRMLEVEVRDPPRIDLPAVRRIAAVPDAPQVAAYATRSGDRLTVMLLSRRVPFFPDRDDPGYTPVTLSLPIASAGRLTLYRMAGPHDANNVDGPAVDIEQVSLQVPADPRSIPVDAALGAGARGLPPGSAFVYVFEQVDDGH